MPDLSHRDLATRTSNTGTDEASASEPDLQDLVGNAAIVEHIRANNQSTGPRELDPDKNGIVILGLNSGASSEARALNRFNRGNGGAISATPSKKQDTANVDGVDVDLSTTTGAAVFASSLGVPDQLAIDVAQYLVDSRDKSRDELSQFIKILSQAEMGEREIDRMVLSGHSVGSQIWGDDNGVITFEEFATLFKIFPIAAAQVKHLMLSACYAGGETRMADHQKMLPGVESIWAYQDSSPGTWSGAKTHMESWVDATMPGMDPGKVDPTLAGDSRKAENVSTWNSVDGFQGQEIDPMSYSELHASVTDLEAMFLNYFEGKSEVYNPQSGALREYYGMIQRLTSHPEASTQVVREMEARRDTVIRLLYFKVVSQKFHTHYKAKLNAGLIEAGISIPNFETLGRAGLAQLIAELEASGGGTDTATAVDLLKRGLWALNPDLVPTSWV
jgi:hypothetical protein